MRINNLLTTKFAYIPTKMASGKWVWLEEYYLGFMLYHFGPDYRVFNRIKYTKEEYLALEK